MNQGEQIAHHQDDVTQSPPSNTFPSNQQQPPVNLAVPEWITGRTNELQVKYNQDRFVPVLREPGVWRIKCWDCPGKLYYPGPEETLMNFEVHLKNRYHRDNVNSRLARERGSAS
ncbi:SWI/SNF chromatin-remodeling complex subunit [Tulasnella sp. 419]|nr:SWI/SNF chromatin-remodeling complex subunit [Tulasnella sp. 418]KAG8959573.1 SWI/SNF chromatin-remodeling complex subunit [Tulasnella sp. 419]